jgi:2-oxo-4-hydroxy-4-carboxy-5-ureidoimidazoline decarboxylase
MMHKFHIALPDNMAIVRKSMQTRHRIAELNALDRASFVRIVGPVFEHSPWIADEASAQRPFANFGAMLSGLCATVRNATDDQKLALINAHPDLVGRAALAGTLTPASTGEQAAAGLNRLTPEEIALFQKQNEAYRQKFGFPFVICARLNKKEAIVAGFARRLQNSREEEILAALEEIFKIADLRLRDLITE